MSLAQDLSRGALTPLPLKGAQQPRRYWHDPGRARSNYAGVGARRPGRGDASYAVSLVDHHGGARCPVGLGEISRRGAETPRESARPAPATHKSGASPPGASHRRLADLGGTGSGSATRKAGINARSVSETATSAASTDHRQSAVERFVDRIQALARSGLAAPCASVLADAGYLRLGGRRRSGAAAARIARGGTPSTIAGL